MAALNEKSLVLEENNVERTIALATARDYPAAAMASSSKKTVNHEYIWSAYKMPDQGVLAVADGAAQTEFGNEQPVRMIGYTEEIRKGWAVTRRGKAASTYTNHNTSAWQKGRALELMQMMKEQLLLSRQEQADYTGDSGAGLASKTRGLIAMLSPATWGLQSNNAIPADYRMNAAQACNKPLTGEGKFDVTDIMSMLSATAKRGNAKVDLVGIVGPGLATAMGQWAYADINASGPRPFSIRQMGDEVGINLDIQVFKFPTGMVRNVIDYYIDKNLTNGTDDADHENNPGTTNGTGIWIDPKMLKLLSFQPLTHTDKRDDDGAGERGFWAADFGFAYDVPSKAMLYVPGFTVPSAG